jgi:hypothetical protein
MRARALIVLLALALVALASGTVNAATLRTLHVLANVDQHIRVVVTNLGTKALDDLTVTLTNPSGDVVTPFADNCAEGGPLPARNTCQVVYNNNQRGFATITTKGKFSASIHLIGPGANNSPTVAVIPATK